MIIFCCFFDDFIIIAGVKHRVVFYHVQMLSNLLRFVVVKTLIIFQPDTIYHSTELLINYRSPTAPNLPKTGI